MKTILILLIACIAGYAPTDLFAQPQQSENFRITKSVLDAGGGASTSTNFRLVSAFGQPTPIGVSSSTNFVLSAGFLSPAFGVSPLSPIQDLVIMRMTGLSNDVKLDWSAIPGATLYTIYRDTNPLFIPGPGNQIGTSATNTFTDVGAVGLPAIKYFYNVTSTAGNSPASVAIEPRDAGAAKHDNNNRAKETPASTKSAVPVPDKTRN